jgi:hypothetical protein
MKKLIALFTVLLIVTGAMFAQVADGVSVGGWGKAVFLPVQGTFKDDKNTFTTGVGSGWGPAYAAVNVTFAAADGRIGGQANIERGSEPSSISGGLVNIWAKPFASDILKITVGKYEIDTYRGKIGTDGDIHNFIGGPGKSPDRIFQRLNANGSNGGGAFVSKPIPALGIFFDLGPGWNTYSEGLGKSAEAKDIYKKIQAGLGYEIDGIGLARAQWVGNTMDITPGKGGKWEFDPSTYDGKTPAPTKSPDKGGPTSAKGWKWVEGSEDAANPARIEAAFNLTAVEGLKLDVGLKFPIPVKEEFDRVDVTHQDNIKIGAAGQFTAGDFGVTFGLYGDFAGKTEFDYPSGSAEIKQASAFDIIAIPSYYLAALDATVGADVGLRIAGESEDIVDRETGKVAAQKDDSVTFGLGGWVKRDLGKGFVKTGLAFSVNTPGDSAKDPVTTITWPIILELSF